MKTFIPKVAFGLLLLGVFSSIAYAENYSAEVMSVKGSVYAVLENNQKTPLKEGDLLKVGTGVEVGADSYVDLAYDNHWNNMSRIGPDSRVWIRSIYPTGLYIDKGDVLARLHKLPARSTFEVETPTAVAAVRGSEYRTVYRDGATAIYNLHTSNVEVYCKDPSGNMMRDAVILRENEKTAIEHLGETPKTPQVMPEKERAENRGLGDGLQKDADVHVNAGEVGKTQDIEKVEKDYTEELNKRVEAISGVHQDSAAVPGTQKEDAGSSGPASATEPKVDQKVDKTQQIIDRAEKRAQDVLEKAQNDEDRKDSAVATAVDKSGSKSSGGSGDSGGNNDITEEKAGNRGPS